MRLLSSRILVVSPAACRPIALATCRSGEIGVVDVAGTSANATQAIVAQLKAGVRSDDLWGVRFDADRRFDDAAIGAERIPIALLACVGSFETAEAIAAAITRGREFAEHVVCEVHDVAQAQAAEAAGADAVLLKGHEAGGWVGRLSSFILLQRVEGALRIPYWIQGGIGLHTAAAAHLAGAGIALCEQLWLTDEAGFSKDEQETWRALDGSETALLGRGDRQFRCFDRRGRERRAQIQASLEAGDAWEALVRAEATDTLLPLGQDIVFAGKLESRARTVGAVLDLYRVSIREHLEQAAVQDSLGPDGPLARDHGTRYPIVQGPMTRVSDRASFARSVADAGALPFLALAALRTDEIRTALAESAELLGTSPFGVGILGFLPPELLDPQLEIVRAFRPPFALLAGGVPQLAARIEAHGTPAYMHAPSPSVLRLYLRGGVRRFVLEGSECGGHIGPRTSFVLWDLAVDALIDASADEDLTDVCVLFAGGIHDALSAAMVAAIAAPIADLGVRFGVLMGTAYLFTKEIVETEALLGEFQKQAIDCEQTSLLNIGGGYVTRCAQTEYVETFDAKRRELAEQGRSKEDALWELERFNVGRLRIASKGVKRAGAGDEPRYEYVGTKEQRKDGCYMIGDVATLRRATVTMAQLHADVSEGSLRRLAQASSASRVHVADTDDIAIIGMDCLLPGGPDLRTYWRHIVESRCAVVDTDQRWRLSDYFNLDRQDPNGIYARWGCYLDDILFDPTEYGIAPISMPSIEPLQLLAVEIARRALDDAHARGAPVPPDRTGVIFAAGGTSDLQNDFTLRTLLHGFVPKIEGITDDVRQRIFEALERHHAPWTEDTFPGTLMTIVAGRVANRLNLRGGNFTVDAACASSLAALEVGIAKIRAGRLDAAIVGTADGSNDELGFMAFSRTQALSPTGRSRPFDDSADGLVMGEGVAAMVLKRRCDAERDGNRIYAVIKGIGSSGDGRARSLVAPHTPGQVVALRRAYADAGVPPVSVELIEAHGTGTAVGDPTEVSAITRVVGTAGRDGPHCAIGSVKSAIGHTKAAAGLAGLVKGALALHHKVLPATVGVEVPNTRIDFSKAPVYINAETRPWLRTAPDHPRRCGVSAFGFGGTNFHAVLEEYVPAAGGTRPCDLAPRPVEIVCVEGATRAEVRDTIDELLAAIEHPDMLDLGRFAAAHRAAADCAAPSRPRGTCRLAVIVASGRDLVDKLESARRSLLEPVTDVADRGIYYGEHASPAGDVGFLFPGQGSQRVNMLRDVLVTWPSSRRILEAVDAQRAQRGERRLSTYLYPRSVFTDEEHNQQEKALAATQVAQPALGVIDMIALDVLDSFGLRPDAVGGHSYGEYAALCAAGVFERDDLIRLSELRGRLVFEATADNPGAMASVQADADAVRAILTQANTDVEVANLNAPDQVALGGSRAAIEEVVRRLGNAGLPARKIPVTAAFHTAAMNTAAVQLAAVLAETPFHAPKLPVYSNSLGARYPANPGDVRDVLSGHIRRPVRFVEQIEAMYADGVRTFVECGPGTVLSRLVKRTLDGRAHTALALDMPGRDGLTQLAHLVAHTHALGHDPRLDAWFDGRFDSVETVETVLALAKRKAEPAKTAWRLNVGVAEPASKSPARHPEPTAPMPRPGRIALKPRRVQPSNSPYARPSARSSNGSAPKPVSSCATPAEDFTTVLLEAVSERTGYPIDMLPLDAHMEADLGIDSIKRMEILGAMSDFGQILEDPSGAPLAEIARLRTLQGIIDWHAEFAVPRDEMTVAPQPVAMDAGPAAVERYIVSPESRALETGSIERSFSKDGVVLIVGDAFALTAGLRGALRHEGHRTRIVSAGRTTRAMDAERYEADLGSSGSLAALRDLMHDSGERVAAVIHLAGLTAAPAACDLPTELFLLLRTFENDLRTDASPEGARIVVVSALGGRLGFADIPRTAVGAAGVLGVAKSIAREWPEVRVQCIDVDNDLDAPALVAGVMGELQSETSALEVGLSRWGRVEVGFREVDDVPAPIKLAQDAVVLITGGARGITAQVAIGLAKQTGARLVLVGSSPAPSPSDAMPGDAAEIRRRLIEVAKSTRSRVTPADVERDVRGILKAREIRDTLAAIERAGGTAAYHAVDLRNPDAFRGLLEQIYATYGRIDGVIHGAGVSDDRRIGEKTLASFRAVYDTKVPSAMVLSEALRPQTSGPGALRFVLLFSSVAGRFGNAGQCDYSAANETLNKLACHLAQRWPHVRVTSIGWGPWEGGMVSDAHRLMYASRGVGLIPLETGVSLCLSELARQPSPDAEVLISTDPIALVRGLTEIGSANA